jgi:hypothetical protein
MQQKETIVAQNRPNPLSTNPFESKTLHFFTPRCKATIKPQDGEGKGTMTIFA